MPTEAQRSGGISLSPLATPVPGGAAAEGDAHQTPLRAGFRLRSATLRFAVIRNLQLLWLHSAALRSATGGDKPPPLPLGMVFHAALASKAGPLTQVVMSPRRTMNVAGAQCCAKV